MSGTVWRWEHHMNINVLQSKQFLMKIIVIIVLKKKNNCAAKIWEKYSVINSNFYIFKVCNIYQSTYYILEIAEMFYTLIRIKNYERST